MIQKALVAIMNNSELNFLGKIIPNLSKMNLLPGNEDAVAWVTPKPFQNEIYVCNVDTIAWSSDALPYDMTLSDFGDKIVTITISDLVAKGAQPYYFMCSINGPLNDINSFTEVFNGIEEKCQEYNIAYLGGDLGTTSEFLITGICIGFTPGDSLIKRSTAKSGNIVCASGYFGYTGLGFAQYLKENIRIPHEHPIIPLIRQKMTKPVPRLDLIHYLRKYATSAIDSSDGLALSLYHLSNESKVKVVIDTLPLPNEILQLSNEFSFDLESLCLYAGEEFEILFTMKESDYSLLVEELGRQNIAPPIIIGKVKNGSGVYFNTQPLKVQGWDSLTKGV
jgi:thiamine-monophosphate kinase